MQLAVLDRCAVPRRLKPVLWVIKRRSGCTFESLYRGQDAAKLLARFGKHTQAYLYEHQNEPGFNPANPPGFSTHELFNDGMVYPRLRRGAKLEYWQLGIDVDDQDVEDAIAAAAHYGWHLRRPYSSGSEQHHLNFTKKPVLRGAALHLWRHRR
jgi:hypothetical protein